MFDVGRYDVQLHRKFPSTVRRMGWPLTLLQGNERWLEVLETDFLDEFTTAPTKQWITLQGRTAGTVRSASGGGSGAGNITFVTVDDAGSVFRSHVPRNSCRYVLQPHGTVRSARSCLGESSSESVVFLPRTFMLTCVFL